MNRKQTIVAWIGVLVFVFCAWNPKVIEDYTGGGFAGPAAYEYRGIFDEGLTALVARLSSTVVVTSLAIYTIRDKKQVKGSK